MIDPKNTSTPKTETLVTSWLRHLDAEGRSPNTLTTAAASTPSHTRVRYPAAVLDRLALRARLTATG